MSNRTIGPFARRMACRPLGMKFFTGCSQLRALPSSLQKLTWRPMSLTAPPDSWPRISQSWSRRCTVRLASHQMPTVRRRVRVGSGRVRPRRAMSSSCCEVMGKLPVVPLNGINSYWLVAHRPGSDPSEAVSIVCLRSSDRNWLANRSANHFLRAACPAFVLARIADRDGEVVARPVMARLCTGRTLGVVAPARLAPWFLDEVEDGELFSVGIGIARRQCERGWFAKKLVRDRHAEAEPRQLGFGELLQVFEVGELRCDVAAGVVKPVAVVVGPVDAQRTAQSIAELTRGEPVLTRKDLDAVPQAGRSLDGYPETQGDVVDVDPALFRQERLLAEDPEVPATSRHLQRSRDAVQLQLALQFSEVEERVVIVGIDGDPFTTLRLRVDGI